MARPITQTLRDAIDIPDSYYILTRAEVFPSRIFFDAITDDHVIATGADAIGKVDSPLRQDIEYNVATGLVTFWCDGELKYAVQGSATIHTLMTAAFPTLLAKPGVLGSKLYLADGFTTTRYTINWGSPVTLTSDGVSYNTITLTIDAVHAVSSTQAVLIARDDGGFRPILMDGSTPHIAPGRFMFPKRMDWDDSDRLMIEMATFSGAAKLGNKIFVYISNATTGTVEGMFYDYDTDIWSDSFTVVPTDLEVSLCETRISNVYERNGTLYMCVQFIRTDAYEGQQPYSLLLYSKDGHTFSLDRFTIVSALGYRFLARVGSDNLLYLGNCNRVCYSPVTWVFDGDTGTHGLMLNLTSDEIKSISDSSLNTLNLTLVAGKEEYFGSVYLVEQARLKLYAGMKTTAGDENDTLYGTYIIDSIDFGLAMAQRDTKISCVNESEWKLSGLSMPFYAEIFGKSSVFDPMMTKDTVNLYPATGGGRTATKFLIDFWNQEPMTITNPVITGIDMLKNGGVDYFEAISANGYPTTHYLGIRTKDELKDILDLVENPKITSTTLNIKVYGWSHIVTTGVNDSIHVVLVLEDENGNEKTIVSTDAHHWSNKWPLPWVVDEDPISMSFVSPTYNFVVGDVIKKVGVAFYAPNETWFNIARVEFLDGVEVPLNFTDPNTPWSSEADGTFKVPASGRPFIMFSEKPYNSWNFSIVASFMNTVTGGIDGFPTACGLIGHAQDAANYILARYNKRDVDSVVEIIKCRNGVETLLVDETPGTDYIDADGKHQIMFRHKDGQYTVYMWSFATSRFEQVAHYDWTEADGFMFTDRIETMKCGIYGNIGAPFVRILGYYSGMNELTTNADGMPIDPLYSMAGFPASGAIRIGDSTYNYTQIVAQPTVPRGPYQFRNMGKYPPPYGTNESGLECRDFAWNSDSTLYNNKLIAIDSGACFVCTGVDWDIWITTNDNVVEYYNRARYYSANEQIGKLYHTLSNKVWIVGGFLIPVTAEVIGMNMKQPEGAIATLELPGEIKCYWYQGSGGDDDTTIADLVTRISDLSGATANFPGDHSQTSLSVNGTTLVYDDYWADGFDFYYEISAPATHEIQTNLKVKSTNYENGSAFASDTGCKIVITSLGVGYFSYQFVSTPSNTVLFAMRYESNTTQQKMRVLVYDSFISLYQNGRWVTTIALDDLIYTQADYIRINASGTFTMRNIRVRELGDWREAIYIDLETDGRSAIGSVIQERPVEIVANPDGSLDYWYAYTRDTVVCIHQPNRHRYRHQVPRDGASDTIIQSYNDVKTYQNTKFAKALGFSTKLMRLVNLYAGAREAAIIALTKAYDSRHHHELTIRPDISLMVGDIYALNYISEAGRHVDCDVVIESIDFSFGMTGKKVSPRMEITGREYEAI